MLRPYDRCQVEKDTAKAPPKEVKKAALQRILNGSFRKLINGVHDQNQNVQMGEVSSPALHQGPTSMLIPYPFFEGTRLYAYRILSPKPGTRKKGCGMSLRVRQSCRLMHAAAVAVVMAICGYLPLCDDNQDSVCAKNRSRCRLVKADDFSFQVILAFRCFRRSLERLEVEKDASKAVRKDDTQAALPNRNGCRDPRLLRPLCHRST